MGTGSTDRKQFAGPATRTDNGRTGTLYRAPTTAADADAIADWLRGRVGDGVAVDVRERFLSVHGDEAQLREPEFCETRADRYG